MTARSITSQPFSFPARDGYALRGRISAPRIDEPEHEAPHPAEADARESAPSQYAHPFFAPASAAAEDEPQFDAVEEEPAHPDVPFTRLPTAADRGSLWETRDGSEPEDSRGVVVVNGAVAVPASFYRAFADHLATAGFTVITYDYRGIGTSRSRDLKTLEATMTDWALLDMAGAIDWVMEHYPTDRLFLVGHGFGGQVAGLLDNTAGVRAMATVSSQSGYWKLMGGSQKSVVRMHMTVTVPTMSKRLGYMPWSRFGSGEDLPKGVALQWAKWSTDPAYLFGDDSLPLERYADFGAPILAYSVSDDDWATGRAVDAMMEAYPAVFREHIVPSSIGLKKLGHFGYFKEGAEPLWGDLIRWFDAR
jgi:predicted alpha/beta hydrolase